METRLFIEKNSKTDEYQIKIVVGIFNNKQDALNYASFIAITKSVDFAPEPFNSHMEEVLEVDDLTDKTIH
jgi:hypothetical protein